jgi:hypothetical protein
MSGLHCKLQLMIAAGAVFELKELGQTLWRV